jgi:hypothetical protein
MSENKVIRLNLELALLEIKAASDTYIFSVPSKYYIYFKYNLNIAFISNSPKIVNNLFYKFYITKHWLRCLGHGFWPLGYWDLEL